MKEWMKNIMDKSHWKDVPSSGLEFYKFEKESISEPVLMIANSLKNEPDNWNIKITNVFDRVFTNKRADCSIRAGTSLYSFEVDTIYSPKFLNASEENYLIKELNKFLQKQIEKEEREKAYRDQEERSKWISAFKEH